MVTQTGYFHSTHRGVYGQLPPPYPRSCEVAGGQLGDHGQPLRLSGRGQLYGMEELNGHLG